MIWIRSEGSRIRPGFNIDFIRGFQLWFHMPLSLKGGKAFRFHFRYSIPLKGFYCRPWGVCSYPVDSNKCDNRIEQGKGEPFDKYIERAISEIKSNEPSSKSKKDIDKGPTT